jgi:hypothetical protein
MVDPATNEVNPLAAFVCNGSGRFGRAKAVFQGGENEEIRP